MKKQTGKIVFCVTFFFTTSSLSFSISRILPINIVSFSSLQSISIFPSISSHYTSPLFSSPLLSFSLLFFPFLIFCFLFFSLLFFCFLFFSFLSSSFLFSSFLFSFYLYPSLLSSPRLSQCFIKDMIV